MMKSEELEMLRRIAPTESDEQIALIQWCGLWKGQFPELGLLYAIPNGGSRSHQVDARGNEFSIEAARMKKEGVKRGVPDLCLPVPRAGSHGLYIELKSKSGRASQVQKEWIEALQQQGYTVKLCRGFNQASETILKYLQLPRWKQSEMPHAE